MAYIQKRTLTNGTPAYIVKWKTADGKHRTKGGFRTRKAAQAYATEVEHAIQRGNTFDPKAGGVTFRQVAQAWLASRHDLKATTLAGYRKALAPAEQRRTQTAQKLSIDATFGGYPLNKITREQITAWVEAMKAAGKHPVTIRHAVLLVKQVLAQAVADGRLADNPADYVKLPGQRGTRAIVDDPSQFLTAAQVQALTDATPWPYNVYVHLAAWAGLRAAELCGLFVSDVVLLPNHPGGFLNIERTVQPLNGALTYLTPKTQGSKRRVPLTAATTAILRDYLAEHPRRADGNGTAPLFPGLKARGPIARSENQRSLVWASPLRHVTFYQTIYKPAVVRAGLNPALVFHSLRHTYVSLCVAAGIPPLEISRFAGHSKVTTTLGIYAHLFESDHSAAMTALGAMGAAADSNVVPLRAVGTP
jgi:integrase